MAAFLRYTVLRLVLFAAVLAVLYAVGARGVVLLAVAVLASGLLSLVLLNRQRDEMALAITASYNRVRADVDQRARAEDSE